MCSDARLALVAFVVGTFLASLTAAALLVRTRHLHGAVSNDSTVGVQKLHVIPTPRIGSLALVAGAAAAAALFAFLFVSRASAADSVDVDDTRRVGAHVFLATLPAFAIGFAEDITQRVGILARLLATLASGALFVALSGYSVVDGTGVDGSWGAWLLGAVVTTIAIGGTANAMNIIDGVHGLASGTAIAAAGALAVVASDVDDNAIVHVALALMAALGGFFALNFPHGRLFLGDAGAYAAGTALSALAVALGARHAELTPFIGVMALAYPWIETLVSVHRRVTRQRTSPGQADRLHLHSLVFHAWATPLARRLGRPALTSATTTVLVGVLPMCAALWTTCAARSTALVGVGVVVATAVYLALYARVAAAAAAEDGARQSPV